MGDAEAFCPGCGARAGAPPLMPVRSRLAGHVRLLGIIWVAISTFRLLPGLFLFSFFHHRGPVLPLDLPLFVPGLLRMIGAMFLVAGALGLIAGWGLLARQPWARTLAIVLGCFNLIDMPFGTALGIYTLWVLLPTAAEEEYRKITQNA